MPLTDLHSVTLPRALRYTSRFGLNRSQGTYFYHIVQKSPPGTYLADIKHISQPSSTSLLARLLREACGTLPKLIPQQSASDNTRSRQAWHNFEIKHGLPQMAEPIVSVDQNTIDGAVFPSSNDPEDPVSMITTSIQELLSPPPATQPSLATLPTQRSPSSSPTLRIADTYQYPHPYGIINTQSSFASPMAGSNLLQHLHHHNRPVTYPEATQQDDMDCLPSSPFISSDVDMDIPTDTAPTSPSYDHHPRTQWNAIPEYAGPVLPPYTTFLAPPAYVQESPTSANQHNSGFAPDLLHTAMQMHWNAARDNLPRHMSISATPEHPVDFSDMNIVATHHYPVDKMSDQIQVPVEIHWQEPPDRAGTSDPKLVATLLGEFERSLTLVANETPSSGVDNWNNYNHRTEPTSACIVEDEPQVAPGPIAIHPLQANVSGVALAMVDHVCLDDHLDDSEVRSNFVSDADGDIQDDSFRFEREATEPLGEGEDQTLPRTQNLCDPPRPMERVPTEPPEGQNQLLDDPARPQFDSKGDEPLGEGEEQSLAYFLDLGDQPQQRDNARSLLTDALPKVPPGPRVVHPLVCPHPPTPPRPHCSTRSRPSSKNQHKTRQLVAPLAAATEVALDIKRPVTKVSQERMEVVQASVRAGRRCGGLRSLQMRSGRNRCEVEEREDGEEIWPKRRNVTKRTRFVMPNDEDEEEEDSVEYLLSRPFPCKAMDAATCTLTGSSSISMRRMTGSGPTRSILRNTRATAMPYQKIRHRGRRASVP